MQTKTIWDDEVENINKSLMDILGLEEDGDFELTSEDVDLISTILQGTKKNLDALYDVLSGD